jgi:hypothetical protein
MRAPHLIATCAAGTGVALIEIKAPGRRLPLPSNRKEQGVTATNRVTWSAERRRPNIVAELLDQHRRIDALCTNLEHIADRLPSACPTRCRRASFLLATLLPSHSSFERPVLAGLLAGEEIGPSEPLLPRIIGQHHEDEGLAQEIVQALEPLCEGEQAQAPEALGYMLRCFFNGVRRSMLVEELALKSVIGELPEPKRLPRVVPVPADRGS